jgi:tryptophanyl-tRNA synthetase
MTKPETSKPMRVMSGMRTTSSLHIGNYFGALKNWVELQKTSVCYFGAMNWHALTEHYKTPDVFEKFNRIFAHLKTIYCST